LLKSCQSLWDRFKVNCCCSLIFRFWAYMLVFVPAMRRAQKVWYEEEFEDTKGLIRIRKSNKKKDKRTNNDLQNICIKLKKSTFLLRLLLLVRWLVVTSSRSGLMLLIFAVFIPVQLTRSRPYASRMSLYPGSPWSLPLCIVKAGRSRREKPSVPNTCSK